VYRCWDDPRIECDRTGAKRADWVTDKTARGSTATKVPARAAVAATARPLPGATFSPAISHKCRGAGGARIHEYCSAVVLQEIGWAGKIGLGRIAEGGRDGARYDIHRGWPSGPLRPTPCKANFPPPGTFLTGSRPSTHCLSEPPPRLGSGSHRIFVPPPWPPCCQIRRFRYCDPAGLGGTRGEDSSCRRCRGTRETGARRSGGLRLAQAFAQPPFHLRHAQKEQNVKTHFPRTFSRNLLTYGDGRIL
jgi:hypothetical protein